MRSNKLFSILKEVYSGKKKKKDLENVKEAVVEFEGRMSTKIRYQEEVRRNENLKTGEKLGKIEKKKLNLFSLEKRS